LDKLLRPEPEWWEAGVRERKHKEEDLRRWEQDGTIDEEYAKNRICRGVLQMVAAKLLDQKVQERAGEHDFDLGISLMEDAREKMREYRNPRPKRRGRKPDPKL
jgi:hypothetical protein